MRAPTLTRRRRAALVALLSIAALGCGDSASAPERPEPTSVVLVDSSHSVGLLAREPMLASHPNGTWFVGGYGDPGPKLFRSDDRGASWSQVEVGTEADGAVANSDVDLAVGPDGTLYYMSMGFDRTTFEGTHVVMGVSHDGGATWTWTRLSEDRFDDRPWVEVTPDGTAHAIWNDGGGVSHAVSRDGGRTWREGPRIHDSGGSSHLAVGPANEVAVRIVPLSASGNKIDRGTDLIAVSADGGVTWAKHPPPGDRAWGFPLGNPADLPRWVEPIAFDGSGALYYLWSEGTTMRLARSADRGATWTTWTTWTIASGPERCYFPYLIARGDGELVASWVRGEGDSLRAEVARVRVGAGEPSVILGAPIRFDSWAPWQKTPDPQTRDAAGEYLAIAFDGEDGVAMVSPIQNAQADRFGFSFWRLAFR
ncbi:MAG: sialidase family protein [Gemmatimonadales bacterium]